MNFLVIKHIDFIQPIMAQAARDRYFIAWMDYLYGGRDMYWFRETAMMFGDIDD